MQSFLSPVPTLKLNPAEIHLWFTFPAEIQDKELLQEYEKLLTPPERAQWQRFRFARLRHQYLITRALVRTTLSRYIDIEPRNWQFSKNEYGRPEIMTGENIEPLRFNLSHTTDLIICGVILKSDIGVDVENMKRNGTTVEIANRFFSPQEVKDLSSIPEKQQLARFFDYWTLKESYIKARGMGLSLPLEQFTFHISNHEEPLRISFSNQLHDEPTHWQFWLLQPTQHHKAAVSIRQETSMRHQLVMKEVIPLVKEQAFFCTILKQPNSTL